MVGHVPWASSVARCLSMGGLRLSSSWDPVLSVNFIPLQLQLWYIHVLVSIPFLWCHAHPQLSSAVLTLMDLSGADNSKLSAPEPIFLRKNMRLTVMVSSSSILDLIRVIFTYFLYIFTSCTGLRFHLTSKFIIYCALMHVRYYFFFSLFWDLIWHTAVCPRWENYLLQGKKR